MDILFYRYGSICEPDIIDAFESFGIKVIEEATEVSRKSIPGEERIELLARAILSNNVPFVFSINFFPYISDICQRLNRTYICLSVDCPVLELFSSSIRNTCNKIFLFDYAQYERFKPENPDGIYYLPLATNVDRWDSVINNATVEQHHRFSANISFVGSLYNEKSFLEKLSLSQYTQGFLSGLSNAQNQIGRACFLEEALTDSIVSEIKDATSSFPEIVKPHSDPNRYIVANYYWGMQIAAKERIHTLNALAAQAPVTLYTRSDTTPLQNVICKGGVSTLTEMPLVFHNSKININITIPTIQTGLSLRIWDVLGCGGFLLTNYQQEIPSYLSIGEDLDCYESETELLEKVAFYLKNEDIRQDIAAHGYETICSKHTWRHRIAEMFQMILS